MTDEDEILISLSDDKIRLTDENSMLTNTRFLDIRQQTLLFSRFSRDKRCCRVLFGGYEQAERRMMFFIPDFIEINDSISLSDFFKENTELCPLCAVRVKKDRFSGALTHRDYLGALMGLGIKRETVGDIIICDDGCDIICETNVAKYICENITSAGRATVQACIIPLKEIREPKESFEIEFHTVASLRLDAVAAQAFRLSRTKAVEAINKGLVFINGIQTFKCDAKIEENDKIVLRGKGKIILSEILGESQKGRIRINIKIYK
ncbi:MAG: YlmH/Sll1252 family protein [Clostridia bacterium]|nr:YlmH/Sll1252 family protein [Clostridia bacterium]